MWRGAGEDVWFEEAADADKPLAKEIPAWIFFVPLVLISLEPAHHSSWDDLATSRHAHAQLERAWDTSHYSDSVTRKAPTNEPPQPLATAATPRRLESPRPLRPDRRTAEGGTPRRYADRLMGRQISNVQWRSSLRSNSNVLGLELALAAAPAVVTPRMEAARDALREPPASEQALSFPKGRRLLQSIAASSAACCGEAAEFFPVRIMRQVMPRCACLSPLL